MKGDETIAIKVCGPAGSGVMLLGEILGATLNRAGFYCLIYPEYPSRIRGGDNNVQIVISENAEISPKEKVDAIFLLDRALKPLHIKDLSDGAKIYDALELGFEHISCVKENKIVQNMVMIGFIWKLLEQDLQLLISILGEKIDKKFLDINLEAAREGFDLCGESLDFMLKPQKDEIIGASGNEMISRAVVASKCEYASIYPMTPVTSLLNFLSKTDIKMVTPEDEIFAALSALGASIAGIRAMTATSGGGFCLMTEALGFSAMAEIPLVVVLGQRTGPSSGIPTYTSQSDLKFAISPSHGEYSHIVLAPGNLQELFSVTQEAFNMADIYQVPVIILTDKYLSESHLSCKKNEIEKCKIAIDRGKRYVKSEKQYQRYKLVDGGVSPRAIPGETTFSVNSYEHDEIGLASDDGKVRLRQMAKRLIKLELLNSGFEIANDDNAKDVIVTWGSTKDVVREFVRKNQGFAHIHIFRVRPFPKEISAKLRKFKQVFVAEGNSTGQMADIINCQTGQKTIKILKDDGRPFFKEDLEREILNYDK